MSQNNSINMDFGTLAIGQHSFDYQLNDEFFAALEQDEILGGNCTAHVDIIARESSFSLSLQVEGTVQVTCDRCLDPMDIQVEDVEDEVLIKLAREEGEDDEAIYVNEEKPLFDLGWLLYEEIAVSLPVVHSHQPGECNAQMEALLQSHLCTDMADEQE